MLAKSTNRAKWERITSSLAYGVQSKTQATGRRRNASHWHHYMVLMRMCRIRYGHMIFNRGTFIPSMKLIISGDGIKMGRERAPANQMWRHSKYTFKFIYPSHAVCRIEIDEAMKCNSWTIFENGVNWKRKRCGKIQRSTGNVCVCATGCANGFYFLLAIFIEMYARIDLWRSFVFISPTFCITHSHPFSANKVNQMEHFVLLSCIVNETTVIAVHNDRSRRYFVSFFFFPAIFLPVLLLLFSFIRKSSTHPQTLTAKTGNQLKSLESVFSGEGNFIKNEISSRAVDLVREGNVKWNDNIIYYGSFSQKGNQFSCTEHHRTHTAEEMWGQKIPSTRAPCGWWRRRMRMAPRQRKQPDSGLLKLKTRYPNSSFHPWERCMVCRVPCSTTDLSASVSKPRVYNFIWFFFFSCSKFFGKHTIRMRCYIWTRTICEFD